MRLSLTDLFYFVTDEKQRINDGSLIGSRKGKRMLI